MRIDLDRLISDAESNKLITAIKANKLRNNVYDFAENLELKAEQGVSMSALHGHLGPLTRKYDYIQRECVYKRKEKTLGNTQTQESTPQPQPQKQPQPEQNLYQEQEEQTGIEQADQKPDGVISVSDLMNMQFDLLPFQGVWKEFIPKPFANFNTVIHGKPKNGKTALCFKMANYLTNFGTVLYNVADQGIAPTTQDLAIETGITENKNIYLAAFRTLDELKKQLDTGKFDYVFIDLINNYNIGAVEMESFMHKYPNVGFQLVMESTKGGDFRGEQKWTHLPDNIINVVDFKADSRGRLGMGEYIIWPEEYHRRQALKKK